MSTPFPRSKGKRPRTSSEPNKSFVKNVTSRMSGLLPATITKWFTSSSSSNTNGSAQVADATDSSTEDEAPESPITIQPPTKKIRLTSPGEFSQHVPVETRCISTNTESIDEIYTTKSPVVKSDTQKEKKFASTHVQSGNDDTKEETPQDTFFKQEHSVSAIENSTPKRRKSLFGTPQDDLTKRHTSTRLTNVRDPYFKPSLLSSPFYVGRPMYGGAASSYLTPSTFKKKTISVTNETSNKDSVNVSQSARHIMDLLEHYSSPLIEAKRIPQITSNPKNNTLYNTLELSGSRQASNDYSYKNQELYVPSVASILTIKRKARLMESTSAARQIIASHSSSSEYLPYPKTNTGGDASEEMSGDKMTTKIKSRLTRTNRDRNFEMESNTSDTVNLPNVVLQIDKDNLPKFTFGPISTSQPSHSSSIQTPVIITPEALKKSYEFDRTDSSMVNDAEKDKSRQGKNNNDYYTFSRPVQVSSESKTSSSPPIFSFGSPERNIDNGQGVKTKNNQLPLSINNQTILDNKISLQKSSDWNCSDCWVKNKADVNKCICCGGKRPVKSDESKKCSICNVSIKQPQSDKCTECEKKTNIMDKLFVAKEVNNTKWKCNDCWVENTESVDKCVCCGGKNPNKTTSSALIISNKINECDWICKDCWIKNKPSLAKCAACGGQKPGTQIVSFNNFGTNTLAKDSQGNRNVDETLDSTFKTIAKSQSERWECPLCLVRNESNRDTCICCEANKPGSEKLNQVKFNFHQPSEITFKFGIQPNTQETCTDIEPEECNMGEESETNNNVLPKTPTFNFGISVRKFQDLSESMDNSAEAPKINFMFGVQKGDQISPVRNNIFNIPNKSDETSKNIEENPQEVPQIFTSPLSNEPGKKNLGLFNTSVTSQMSREMPNLVPLHALNENSTIKKDIPFLNTSTLPSASPEGKTQQNNFTFPVIMPATNLFATTPATTTAMSNISAPLSMNMPTTSTLSIFPKPNVATTTNSSFFSKTDSSLPSISVALFAKTESTTTTSSEPLGTMQPVFSFGGQGSAPPQVDKPKFSFNFTNKTESAPIFTPSFTVSTDNNIPSNKFNLPSNSITGGNALNTTTQMNTVNVLTPGNSLTTSSGSGMFGASVPKENMWSPSTNNMFAANTGSVTTNNGDQKAPAFTFGVSTPFSANNNAPFGSNKQSQQNSAPFGGTAQQAQSDNVPFGGTAVQQAPPNNAPFGSTVQQTPSENAPFGATAGQQAPPNNAPFGSTAQQGSQSNTAFGSNAQQTQSTQPPQNVFGIVSQTTASQPAMFGNPLQSQSTPNIFASLQTPNNPMSMGMFGASNPAVTPSFGALNQSMPTFETASIAPPAQPAPASFNFGGQPSTGIFGFRQQQQQPTQAPPQPENQPGVYGFGAPAGAAPQMQFTIGSAPNIPGRRVRRAMRRTPR